MHDTADQADRCYYSSYIQSKRLSTIPSTRKCRSLGTISPWLQARSSTPTRSRAEVVQVPVNQRAGSSRKQFEIGGGCTTDIRQKCCMRRYKLGIYMDTDQYKIWAASSSSQGLQKFDWKGMQRSPCISWLLRVEKSHAICREPARHEKTARDASSTAEGGRAACDSSKRSEQLSWMSVLNKFANYSSCSSINVVSSHVETCAKHSFASRHVKKKNSLAPHRFPHITSRKVRT
jgi:hypothetical protein